MLNSRATAAQADPEVLPKSDFRQGRRVARNVYHGDEPLFMAATDELAAELVLLLNAGAAALRAPQTAASAAMREACLKAALGACYGPPSSWPGDYPKGWRHPPAWGPDEKLTPTLAAWHDNGARDAWFAIRALAQPHSSQEPGTGGERS